MKRHQDKYLKAKNTDKPAVACLIVELIRKRGGRFLRKCGETTAQGNVLWYDIGNGRAREKTCQALREGAPEIRRKKSKSFEETSCKQKESLDEEEDEQTTLEENDNSRRDCHDSPRRTDTTKAVLKERNNSNNKDNVVKLDARDDVESITQSEPSVVAEVQVKKHWPPPLVVLIFASVACIRLGWECSFLPPPCRPWFPRRSFPPH